MIRVLSAPMAAASAAWVRIDDLSRGQEHDDLPHRQAMSLEDRLLRRDHLTQERSQHRRQIRAPGRLRSHGDMIGIALSYATLIVGICLLIFLRPSTPPHRGTAVDRRRRHRPRSRPCPSRRPAQIGSPRPAGAHDRPAPRIRSGSRGFGADMDTWRVESVVDAVKADPGRAYSDAAHDVLDAFAADGTADAPFALPELGEAWCSLANGDGIPLRGLRRPRVGRRRVAGCPLRVARRSRHRRTAVGTCRARRRLPHRRRRAVRCRPSSLRAPTTSTGY